MIKFFRNLRLYISKDRTMAALFFGNFRLEIRKSSSVWLTGQPLKRNYWTLELQQDDWDYAETEGQSWKAALYDFKRGAK